jgi:CIC family chloride channel protein
MRSALYAGSREPLFLALLGIAVGVFAGAVSVAFRASIELTQSAFLPGAGFAALPATMRFLLPPLGVLLSIAAIYAITRRPAATGVVHIIDRLAHAGGRLPVANGVLQFVAAALLLICGAPMGREGPAIHLGAVSGSFIAQRLGRNEQGTRTMVAAGVAAAIGAAFNTPLAGVMLALEVVLMEYSVAAFMPILLAAASGATVGRLVYGAAPAFGVPQVIFGTSWELVYVAAMGCAIGCYSAAFIALARFIMRATRRLPWWCAMLGAGVLAGALGLAQPEILGIGYDVIERTLENRYTFATLASIAALKLLATGIGVGARLPAGLIGPTLVMGAAFGGVFGSMATTFLPQGASNVTLYAMLGMAGMMGATLHAPISALLGLLELTGDPQVILPGLVTVATALLVRQHVFLCEPIFAMQMRETTVGVPLR